MKTRFLKLMDIILHNLLGITKIKYNKEFFDKEKGPIKVGYFYSAHVVEPIENYKVGDDAPLKEETIDSIDDCLDIYFGEDMFREKTVRSIFNKLAKYQYINSNPLEKHRSFNKDAASKILRNVWHYYYDALCNGKESVEPYNVDSFLQELAQGNLIATLEVEDYEEALNNVHRIRVGDVKENPDMVEMIYNIFIKKFIEMDLDGLPEAEFNAFIDVVYYLSEIFDYTDDDRSYHVQVVALNCMNNYYDDDFKDVDAETIRRLIGFVYGVTIAVKHNNTRSDYYITLSEDGNLIIGKDENLEEYQDEPLEKLDICKKV